LESGSSKKAFWRHNWGGAGAAAAGPAGAAARASGAAARAAGAAAAAWGFEKAAEKPLNWLQMAKMGSSAAAAAATACKGRGSSGAGTACKGRGSPGPGKGTIAAAGAAAADGAKSKFGPSVVPSKQLSCANNSLIRAVSPAVA